MKNKLNRLSLAVTIAAAAFASQAHAGGYQINEQSVSGQGYGHAGRSSNVNDATIVFGNPAGMAFLERAQVTAGGTYLNVSSSISHSEATNSLPDVSAGGAPLGPPGTSSRGDMVPGTLVPFAFYAQPLNERLAFGFGVYAPFGSKTDYESDFAGSNFGTLTEVRVISAQPTLSYRFNDQLALGAGITYNRVDGELRRLAPRQVAEQGGVPLFTELDARVDGDDDGWGYNLGVIYQPVPETTLGLTYRSEVDYTLTGDFRAIATADLPDGQGGMIPEGAMLDERSARLDLTTPETVNFSVTQQMNERLKLMAGASWVRWSRFDEIRVVGPAGETITLEEQNYTNAWAYALGGEYQLNPQLALRAGITLDFTPTSDELRSVRIPSDDRRIFSVGAGWSPTDDLTLDFAYSYLTERRTSVSQELRDTDGNLVSLDDVNPAVTYSADYKNEAHGFGAQLTYRF